MISRGHKNHRAGLALIAMAVAAVWGGSAHASGFALMEQNASGLGNAYAGQAAAAEDASTIFFNPAGMTYLPSRQFVIGVNAIRPSGDFNNDGSTNAPLQTLGGDGGDFGDLSAVPNAYLSWQLSPEFWAGIGLSVPFGLGTEYDEDWMGRFYATESHIETININPSIAWKINEAISLGAGLNYQKIDARLESAVNYSAGVFEAFGAPGLGLLVCNGAGPGGTGCEGIGKVEGDDWSWGWNIGAMFRLSPDTRLGLAYRSKVEHTLKGESEFSNVPTVLGAPVVAGADIEADVELPESISVALSHQLTPKLQLLADYTWTGWDSVQSIVIADRSTGGEVSRLDLNFRNSYRIGLGANYQLNDAWKLRAGVAFDKSPVRDTFRTPRLPDEDRVWLALGAQWNISKQTAIDFGYVYIKTTEEPSVDLNEAGSGHLVGDYDSDVHIVGVQARYSF